MARRSDAAYPPWAVVSGPDPAFDDTTRRTHHAVLTSAALLDLYRERFGEDVAVGYDVIIRRLGLVWDCRWDGAASVVGFRCARCGRALADGARRDKETADNVAYVRDLCAAYVRGGVDALAELIPDDVEWIPRIAEGRVLRGTHELRAFLAERPPGGPVPQPVRVESIGEHVLVHFTGAGEVWSVYLFERRRLVRAVSFDSKAVAVRAAA
ncbi:hypothetical protein DVA67_016645 [Solirubrobacter sp. CPCC 204708]|uniref:SnoaL-like domain-containing protein n=1 Tax=Solirubrobacter deserti TaxID=2282478 RepID=A0ABT4RJ30_9ACTN|nr:hypothetical protein [Solirubrobacter deserti]MBE2317613.1 hypothetical protein [Solirubrobacter deserti]MDA0138562.1 hypothetical protein [Solirubrobacter deserti]